MDSRIVDASLLPELAPRPFKFTSKQGRSRRTRLLSSALELLREKPPEAISLAGVCERAGIPRPSAYHFFPNVDAIFLGIRMLHGEMLIEAAAALDHEKLPDWKAFIERMIDIAVEVTRSEPAFQRLIYGTTLSGAKEIGQELDARMAKMGLDGVRQHFGIPCFDDEEQVFAITLTIIDSVFRLSYRRYGQLTDGHVIEAKKAAIAYLSLYLDR